MTEKNNESKKNTLLAFKLNNVQCSRCGNKHEQMLLKQLHHQFTINESVTINEYGWIKIIPELEETEPLPKVEDTGFPFESIGKFKNPMVVSIENGTEKNYTFWSFCQETQEPLFFAFEVKVERIEEDGKEQESESS